MQRMIEDTHERWLDQEEEYEQEREAFHKAFSSYESLALSF